MTALRTSPPDDDQSDGQDVPLKNSNRAKASEQREAWAQNTARETYEVMSKWKSENITVRKSNRCHLNSVTRIDKQVPRAS